MEWQDRSRSPASHRPSKQDNGPKGNAPQKSGGPAAALAKPQGPGAEGVAELFFTKVGSGLFDRDLSQYASAAGKALHVAYGALWGLLYGVGQVDRIVDDPWLAGTAYGVIIWGIGPALLAPAMRLMPAPGRMPKDETALMIAGHVVYGVTAANVFAALMGKKK